MSDTSNMTPEQQIQFLLKQAQELVDAAKKVADDNDLRFTFGNMEYSALNQHNNDLFGGEVYVESDWESSSC